MTHRSVESTAITPNTTTAANTTQAPNVIHEAVLLKLCHISMPRSGFVSSDSSKSKPTIKQTVAAHAATPMVLLLLSLS